MSTGADEHDDRVSWPRTIVGWVGRVLLTGGILILLFVAYQLWGTGIYQARQQDQLRSQFEETLRHSTTTTTAPVPTVTTGPPTTTTLPPFEAPEHGDPVANIKIAKIGMSQTVVEGVNVPDLQKGPGHYPATPFPGQEGNVAIAGHRTTFGAPFGDLDQLKPGDEIAVQTVQGTFTYEVSNDGPFVVKPNDVSVLVPEPDPARPGHELATITLTTCNPRFSAAERLIVQARLVLPAGAVPLPPPESATLPTDVNTAIAGLSGDTGSRTPAIVWGLLAALVGGLWWWAFHRRPRWYVWIAGAVPFAVALFQFYRYLEFFLPANF